MEQFRILELLRFFIAYCFEDKDFKYVKKLKFIDNFRERGRIHDRKEVDSNEKNHKRTNTQL